MPPGGRHFAVAFPDVRAVQGFSSCFEPGELRVLPLGAGILVTRLTQSKKGKRKEAIKIIGKGRPTEFHRRQMKPRWLCPGTLLPAQEMNELQLQAVSLHMLDE